jgi:phosphohistidine phosphatase
MSKQLYIVRHAKSSWDYEDISDIDRPLSFRGIKDADTMACRLKSRGNIPSLMITSPACRALHTATIFAKALEVPCEQMIIVEKIYQGGMHEIINILEKVDDHYSSVMIFGHNPDFTMLANHFMKHPVDNIPTAGVVTLNFSSGSWKDLKKLKPETEHFDFPKKV